MLVYLYRRSCTTMTHNNCSVIVVYIATVSPTCRVRSSSYNDNTVFHLILPTCWCYHQPYVCFSSVFSAPSSPVHNRRLLSTRTIRMSSVELPDDNDKSLSSASTSPCPSPVRYSQVQYYNNYTHSAHT